MKNFIQEGKRLTYTNGETAITSGSAVVVGDKVYVACGDIGASAVGELCTEGVVELDKVSGDRKSVV